MRTRRGLCYPGMDTCVEKKKKNNDDRVLKRREEEFAGDKFVGRKKFKSSPEIDGGNNLFDALPDDLVLCILRKLSSTAGCPADFINVLITCKRLNGLSFQPLVLCKASQKMLAVKAQNWSESAHKFLKLCADSGSVEACFTLGMIRFYCLHNRGSGASLLAKAAIRSHAQALYSLAVIQFNGSGSSKTEKDLRAGVALCARAAFVGHVDAMRELGHCLQDGYGVKQNIPEGRRFLIQANARELALVLVASPSAVVPRSWLDCNPDRATAGPLMSDFGCKLPAPAVHPANQFLSDWFSIRVGDLEPGLKLCSHLGCGRPETRRHEFRGCSVCGTVNYCSRACQALDWKLRHKAQCAPVENGENGGNGDGGGVDGDGNGDESDEDELMFEES